MTRVCGCVFLLLGLFCWCFSTLMEHAVSGRAPTSGMQTTAEGHLSELNRSMVDLQQTIWSGSIKIFGGLCLVVFAILFAAAEGRRGSDKAPPPNPTLPPTAAAVPASPASTSLQTAPTAEPRR